MKAWQGSMAVSDYEGIVSPAYHVCEIIDPSIDKKYFHHLMRNHSYLPEYTRLSTGMRIGQWDLGFDDFKNIPTEEKEPPHTTNVIPFSNCEIMEGVQ
jgi:type I restriction enzyme S subunit